MIFFEKQLFGQLKLNASEFPPPPQKKKKKQRVFQIEILTYFVLKLKFIKRSRWF